MQVLLCQGPFLRSPGRLATNVDLSTGGKDPQNEEEATTLNWKVAGLISNGNFPDIQWFRLSLPVQGVQV